MEGLGLVETVSVGGPHLVSVKVLLSLPGRTVPALTIALVATVKRVGTLVRLKLLSGFKDGRVVTGSKIWLVVLLGVEETSTHGGSGIILWLVVLGSVPHGTGAITSASDFHSLVILGNHSGIESTKIVTVSDGPIRKFSHDTYPVVEKLFSALSMTFCLKTSRDCSVWRLPKYWLLTLTRGT